MRLSYFLFLLLSSIAIANPIVTQTNIFSGEVASNLTVGAPLSVSTTGKVTTGIVSTKVTATANTTTTSTSAVATAVMDTMTITPAAGTYNVWFATTLESNTNNINIFVSIFSGGSISTGSEVSATPQIQGGLTPSLNMNVPISTIAQVAVNGSQAIEVRWRLSAAGTATANNRTMIISRVQ